MGYKLQTVEAVPNEYLILRLDTEGRFEMDDAKTVLKEILTLVETHNVPTYMISGPWLSVSNFNSINVFKMGSKVFGHRNFVRTYAWKTIGLANFLGEMLNKFLQRNLYKGGYVSYELAYAAVRADILARIK